MVPNPCFCGYTLKKATKIWAIFELIFAIILFVTRFSLMMYKYSTLPYHKNTLTRLIIWSIIFLIFLISECAGAVLLLLGSNNKRLGYVRRYFLGSCILLVLILIDFIYFLAVYGPNILPICISLVRIVEKVFGIWLSYAFIQELKAVGVGMYNPFPQNTQVQGFQVQYQLQPLQSPEVSSQLSSVQTQNQPEQQQQKSQEVIHVKQSPV